MNVETLIWFRTNFGYHSNQSCWRGNKNRHAMFTNKNNEFWNRRRPLFLSWLCEVLQQMPKYLKPSGWKSQPFVLEKGVDFLTQQAPKSTASPYISCYCSPICDHINFFQKNLRSRGIERSDESLHTVKNDHLLFCKLITSLVATSQLMAQCKIHGKRSRACALMICKWDANDIHEWKQL